MKRHIASAALCVLLIAPLVASAQTPPLADACAATAAEAPLGPLGRARTVAFEAVLSHERVCALVVNLALDRIRSSIGPPSPDAVVTVSLGNGGGAILVAHADGAPSLDIAPAVQASGGAAAGRAVGPWLLAPGGAFVAPADPAQAAHTILAFAGNRLFLIATGPIDLADLTKSLRERGSAFGADSAFERAVVLDDGAAAALWARTVTGTVGRQPVSRDVLSIAPR